MENLKKDNFENKNQIENKKYIENENNLQNTNLNDNNNQIKELKSYPEILTRKDIANYLGVGLNTVKYLLEKPVNQGGIPNTTLNPLSKKPHRLIYKPKFEEWLTNNFSK